MKTLKLVLYIAILASAIPISFKVNAQEANSCPASVWYGEVDGESGADQGQCLSPNDACKTFEYARQQGENICGQEVHVFYIDEFQEFKQLEWRPPSTYQQWVDSIWRILPWIGPAVGLFIGWLLAYLMFAPKKGAIQ